MANSKLGLPQILITFQTNATTAVTRSARGVVSMILNDENVTDEDGVTYRLIEDSSDIPSNINATNADLISKTLLGSPSKIHAYFIPLESHEEVQEKVIEKTEERERVIERQVDSDVVVSRDVDSDVIVTDPDTGETSVSTIQVTITDTQTIQVMITDTEIYEATFTDTMTETVIIPAEVVQSDALKKVANVKFNYVCHPTGNAVDQLNLATWVASQRANKNKTYKAVVANCNVDNYGVVNFTTGKIKVTNPAYTAALEIVDGDESAIEGIDKYNTYTAAKYTGRIAGILAGLPLDRSATYYALSEVVDVEEYDDIDEQINAGELCLFEEKDGNGVKIARGVNSLHNFSTNTGEDFRFIKIVETIDLIKEDIMNAFRNDYVGKVPNSYDNKMLFVSAINSYLMQLGGNVLDMSATDSNFVEIDYAKQYNYAKSRGADMDKMTRQDVLRYNTGTNVYLTGRITPSNSMEDLTIEFALN